MICRKHEPARRNASGRRGRRIGSPSTKYGPIFPCGAEAGVSKGDAYRSGGRVDLVASRALSKKVERVEPVVAGVHARVEAAVVEGCGLIDDLRESESKREGGSARAELERERRAGLLLRRSEEDVHDAEPPDPREHAERHVPL